MIVTWLGLSIPALFPGFLHAQPSGIHISEFMASSVTIHPDNADLDDYSDWIELHNPTPNPVDLGYHFLTDDLSAPTKWRFPEGTVLPAQGYLVVRADDGDAVPGDIRTREFSPWDPFTVRYHHTNFKLAAEGESIGLYEFNGNIDTLELVPTGAMWQYFDKGIAPGTNWTTITFDDRGWSNGMAQLGYGENDEATTIDFGVDSRDKHPAYYFRHSFQLNNLDGLRQLEVNILADDGAIVHLNGTEIFRLNMPEGPVTHTTYASSLGQEDVFISTNVPTSLLLAGQNTIAVQVHQRNATSTDVSFDLELTAVRLEGNPVLVDSVTYGQQYPDVSRARNPNDDGNWYFFGEPTPGLPNTTHPTQTPQATSAVAFSLANGFHSGSQTITMSTPSPGATIHYTLDGSVPGSDSPVAESAVVLTQSTVVRARAFQPGNLPGPVSTRTFFIDEPDHEVPVVSFVVQPDEFFGATTGIYTNVYKGREAAVHLEYFDEEKQLAFAVNAGSKIAGENIWRFAQKPLTLTMRGKYGDDVVAYQLFPDERTGLFTQFVLRNGGDNWPNAMLRDAMTPHLLKGQSDADVQNYRPVVVYLNGRYWGIHNLREKLDDRYFFNHHHLNSGTYDYLEFAHVAPDVTDLAVAEGDTDAYLALVAAATTNDLSQAESYESVASMMNMESFIDFIVAEDFVYNSSWPHNREFWREKRPDAKWHWVVPDLDRGFNSSNVARSLIDNFISGFPLFRELTDSTTFREQLAQRYAAHLASTFHPQRISDVLDRLDAEVLPEMPRHIARWSGDDGIGSLAARQSELDEIKQFAQQRAAHVRSGIAAHLGIAATAEITVHVVPEKAGTIRLQGVPLLPEYSSSALMYRDIPLTIEAEAAPGFKFAGWDSGLGDNASVTLSLTSDQVLTASFVASGESLIPNIVATDLTLTLAGSPYTSLGSVTVNPGVTLSVEPGVEIVLPRQADLNILGALVIGGTAESPVSIHARNANTPWGVIAFQNATGISRISHAIIRDASIGADPVHLIAAISNMGSTVEMEHLDIEAPATIFARGGNTTLLSSHVYSPYTGDGINIKQGWGRVEDSTFIGNTAPDTDAIDFDGVVDGIIRGNRILAFRGFNSDGIDVGEGCVNLLVSGNLIYNSSDKGISVGQGSEVFIQQNLIVGCVLGVGIKDTGSIAYVDQNTFAGNDIGVAVYEKNLNAGGGAAVVSNTIFSGSKQAPVTTDSLSTALVFYSLSDTAAIAGTGNLLEDPLFNDPAIYDFSLQTNSPAVDAGDPRHAPDPDLTRADIGARYVFDQNHYPYITPNVIVINEIMAHSHNSAPDWIELHNTSGQPVDISGWYLSDSRSDRTKYRIAQGTVVPANGYVVFYEDAHFGSDSGDPGAISPFAFSENGERASVFFPGDGRFLDYLEEEAFGASATGVSMGRHFKASSGTYNFVAQLTPTPGAANDLPLVGPISISEIMYHPEPDGAAEFIELVNIASTNVTLFGESQNEPWQITDGVEFLFPTSPEVVVSPGERVVLVRDLNVFFQNYTVPDGTKVFEWSSGSLNNDGERLELGMPGDVNDLFERQYIRVDRVNFNDGDLWPRAADGQGWSLTRVDESAYGNDAANWIAATPTPGAAYTPVEGGFVQWTIDSAIPPALSGPLADSEGDGIVNLMEYVLGLSPTTHDVPPMPVWSRDGDQFEIRIPVANDLVSVAFELLTCSSLENPEWASIPNLEITPTAGGNELRARVPADAAQVFVLLKVTLIP